MASSGLGDIILGVGQSNRAGRSQTPTNVIEFAEAPWGLAMRLFPVQKIILKAHYGMALDDNPHNVDMDKPIPLDHPAYNEITELNEDVPDEDRTEDYGYYKWRVKVTDWRRQNMRYMTEAGYLRFLYAEGRCNIKAVDHERREMVLSIGRRSGKCVLGNTLVPTDRGIFRIDALGDAHGVTEQSVDVGVAQEGAARSRAAGFYNGGVKATRTLTTHCGYVLGGTDNHRIKVLASNGCVEWKHLADIQVGDVVCIHRGADLWATKPVDVRPYHNTLGTKPLVFPDTLTERWATLLGYLVGDGLWGYPNRTEVTVEHPETWEFLKTLFTELFGSYVVYMDKRTKNTGAVKFNGLGMRKFLSDLGFQLGTARDAKMVPWSIMQSPRPMVQAFLRGLFETDGSSGADGKTVSFCTASQRLGHEVQTLLLNFGIISRVNPKVVKGRTYWMLAIRGRRSKQLFADLIGFDTHKKMDTLLANLQAADREGGNTESIPHQRQWAERLVQSVVKTVPNAHKKQSWTRSAIREVLGNTIKPSTKEDITYSRIAQALPVAKEQGGDPAVIAHWENLVALDYYYDKVAAISEGQAPVYDLCVPEGKSFVANGFVNHNTFLASVISAYETYKLLLKGDPQAYYGLPPSNNIQIISVATDKDQAGLLYQEVSGHYRACGFFRPYTANNTQSYARFQTPKDIERYGRYVDDQTAKATLKVTFRSCIAKGLRGAGNLVVILDEMAHFIDEGQSGADAVYNAVTPSTSAFSPKNPKDTRKAIGPVEGRIISISSPLGRQGMFYKLFQIGMRGGEASKTMLCIQAPTWEVNPSLPASEFEKHYMKDPTVFFTEYGGEFTDRTRGWIEKPEDLFACIDKGLRPSNAPAPRRSHFVGIDMGLVNDYTAVAIGHLEATADRGNVIVLDLVDRIHSREGKYHHKERLDIDDVVEWLHKYSRQYYFAHGVFDQWAGIPFEQALAKRGLTQLKMQHFTDVTNSEVFKNFKDMMWDRRLVLYDHPIVDGHDHCGYIEEILELQAEQKSKNITKVTKPNIDGKFDDMADAIVRMVWLASQHLAKPKYVTGAYTAGGIQGPGGPRSGDYARALLATRRMGSSPDRQQHRFIRGRTMG